MSALGSVITSAVNSLTGKEAGTTIQDFLSNFSSADGALAKTIDPLASFDLYIKFFPTKEIAETKNTWYQNLGKSLVSSAKSMVKNAANNLTGGLLGSIMGDVDILKKREEFTADDQHVNQTFLEYLAAANLIVGHDDWVGEKAGEAVSPLILTLGLYCQSVMIPNLTIPASDTSNTIIGEFPINGTVLQPDNHILKLTIINTKVPLMERIFYPWAREIVDSYWHYQTQPYTTATITVDFSKHNDTAYVFYGCRPQMLNSMQATHKNDDSNLLREVSFLFDYMSVQSKLSTVENWKDMLLDTAGTLAAGAGSLVNM